MEGSDDNLDSASEQEAGLDSDDDDDDDDDDDGFLADLRPVFSSW